MSESMRALRLLEENKLSLEAGSRDAARVRMLSATVRELGSMGG